MAQTKSFASSILLNENENEKLHKCVGNDMEVQASAVVQQFAAEKPNYDRWFKKAFGVACFIKDFTKKSFYIRIYNIFNETEIFGQELYVGFKYNEVLPFFHTFEAHNYPVGFNFASVDEAQKFNNVIQAHLSRIKSKKERSINPSSNVYTSNVMAPPQTLNMEAVVRNNKVVNKTDKAGKKKKITKADIGVPTNFVHVNKGGLNHNAIQELMISAGLENEQLLNNKKFQKDIEDLLRQHGVSVNDAAAACKTAPPIVPPPLSSNNQQRNVPPPAPYRNQPPPAPGRANFDSIPPSVPVQQLPPMRPNAPKPPPPAPPPVPLSVPANLPAPPVPPQTHNFSSPSHYPAPQAPAPQPPAPPPVISTGAAVPPPPAPPPPPGPPPPPMLSVGLNLPKPSSNGELSSLPPQVDSRSELLSQITAFKSGNLKKVEECAKERPKGDTGSSDGAAGNLGEALRNAIIKRANAFHSDSEESDSNDDDIDDDEWNN